ncbi:5-oxoprolinase subunit PxpB [Paraburkholderia hayleyella]|uniref:5-oxoprolinase subunit PxpB n=1 Tax=Paraburkholderia hayleyella TaxID=2152889 RepID=UPI0012921BE7|nr:5-oxoprolinase subunit PxpB [Paraburkholderia hayleyella]
MIQPHIYLLGDSALVCDIPTPATLERQRQIWTMAQAAYTWPHVLDVVPGMNNLTLIFDPLQADSAMLATQLHTAWHAAGKAPKAVSGREIEVPVHYGGPFGPDLEDIAEHTGLSASEVIARHTQVEYTVFFVGFQPGFAYLGGLDPILHAPLRTQPRTMIAAGSVGIGGKQTGIYPATASSRWQLIGHTPLTLFNSSLTPAARLQFGDRVRFTCAGATP